MFLSTPIQIKKQPFCKVLVHQLISIKLFKLCAVTPEIPHTVLAKANMPPIIGKPLPIPFNAAVTVATVVGSWSGSKAVWSIHCWFELNTQERLQIWQELIPWKKRSKCWHKQFLKTTTTYTLLFTFNALLPLKLLDGWHTYTQVSCGQVLSSNSQNMFLDTCKVEDSITNKNC